MNFHCETKKETILKKALECPSTNLMKKRNYCLNFLKNWFLTLSTEKEWKDLLYCCENDIKTALPQFFKPEKLSRAQEFYDAVSEYLELFGKLVEEEKIKGWI